VNDDGWLYGCSQASLPFDSIYNTLYRFNPSTAVCEKLASFTEEDFQTNYSQPQSGFINTMMGCFTASPVTGEPAITAPFTGLIPSLQNWKSSLT
jgi:hypothetical protein